MKTIAALGVLMFSLMLQPLLAQPQGRILQIKIVDGDTQFYYQTKSALVKPDSAELARYRKLVRDVRRALPYAKMAAFRMQLMEQNLALLKTKKEKEKYIRETEKQIKKEFLDDLQNLTIDQGRILVKLIHRETGETGWEIMKNFRGNGTAIFWQSLAKVYGSNLKNTYDPVEDYEIEQIIKQLGFE